MTSRTLCLDISAAAAPCLCSTMTARLFLVSRATTCTPCLNPPKTLLTTENPALPSIHIRKAAHTYSNIRTIILRHGSLGVWVLRLI